MIEVEYGVHVSNKYSLFLDDDADPDDLIGSLAATNKAQALAGLFLLISLEQFYSNWWFIRERQNEKER